ncbi:MAG: hypothetical protein AB7W16_05570 [Candidatus Obscuribacterales bacterium]
MKAKKRKQKQEQKRQLKDLTGEVKTDAKAINSVSGGFLTPMVPPNTTLDVKKHGTV